MFQLHAVLSRMKKSLTPYILPGTLIISLSKVSILYILPFLSYFLVIQVWYQIYCHGIAVFMYKSPLFCSIMAPKCTSSDAGSLDMPERSRKVLPLSEKVNILDVTKNVFLMNKGSRGRGYIVIEKCALASRIKIWGCLKFQEVSIEYEHKIFNTENVTMFNRGREQI